MKALLADMKTIETYQDILTNSRAREFLANPSTENYYEKLRDLLLSNRYIKVKQRMTASFYLRVACYLVCECHKGAVGNTLVAEVASLCELLEKRPKIVPIIHREQRNRVLYLLANYFKPMIDAFAGEMDGLLPRVSSKLRLSDTDFDPFSASDENDLDEEFRELPTCARCGNLAWYICKGCKSISYCSIWCQQLHWSSHKPVCKLKKS